MNDLRQLSADQLRRAADVRERIERLEGELKSLLGSRDGSQHRSNVPKKRHLSATGRAAIIAAAKARWARIRGATSAAPRPKRSMSIAARARLAKIARARWKKAKAAGKKAL